jgi:hypothetical protein
VISNVEGLLSESLSVRLGSFPEVGVRTRPVRSGLNYCKSGQAIPVRSLGRLLGGLSVMGLVLPFIFAFLCVFAPLRQRSSVFWLLSA